MQTLFIKLNHGWSAEPNAPEPAINIRNGDLLLKFYVNPFLYPEFKEEEFGLLRFVRCKRYRLGPTNDEGWYRGQCRFSKLAPAWGEFYLIRGDHDLLNAPRDWKELDCASKDSSNHFLFYFRDDTFECVAEYCRIEPIVENSLFRLGKIFPLSVGTETQRS